MDFVTFLGVLRRQWMVVALCVVLTAGAAVLTYGAVKPTYSATASVVLLAPRVPDATPPAADEEDVSNPFLSFGGSLNIMGGVMVEAFQDPLLREQVEDDGATEDFAVDVTGGDVPVLVVSVNGKTPEATSRTLAVVLDALDTTLRDRQLQNGATPNFLITSALLRRSIEPEVEQGSRIRATAAVALLGIAFAVGMAFAVEAFRRRRREVRAARVQAPANANASILERDAERDAAERDDDVHNVARWNERPARRDLA